jgi:hypothetical protein
MNEGGNKNALNREIGSDGKRDWSFGLFDCSPRYRLCTVIDSIYRSPRVANPPYLQV